MQLSPATCKAIDSDPACKPKVAPGTVGALPVSISAFLNFLLPYLEQALAALLTEGVAAPTEAQLLQKCHELASCR
jgi:hypothetical protein